MEMLYWPLLVVTGVAAGIINTLAGGGSNLTVPALMLMGMPADIANGTNRVGIVLQCVVGTLGFHREDELELQDAVPILALMVAGGLAGALTASYTPNLYLKPVMLGTIMTMSLLILVRPSTVIPERGTRERRVAETPRSWVGLLLAGFYGGFVQAGVGFVLIAALAGTLRYDLVRTNALKLLCALVFTTVAMIVFAWRGQVEWLPGLVLAAGTMAGAHVAVKWAISVSQRTLKWFLFWMTLAACGAALVF